MRVLLAFALWLGLIGSPLISAAENAAFNAALESIQKDQLQRHVDVLSDDTFEGREAGSRGGRASGGYLIKQLSKAEVQPAGLDGSWFQPFQGSQRNILGIVPGSDPKLKDEVIVIGAHYDHVGYGSSTNSYGPTGYIHNGADDNASGTAGLIELADALHTLGGATRRTLLLALWDGEEKGLLGSRHWIAHPTLPSKQVKLMINMDMIGRLRDNHLEVGGIRSSYGLRRLVSQHMPTEGMWADFSWKLKANSDHWPFYEHGVPILLIHTRLHSDYHRPSDDAHKINEEGMEHVTRLLFRLVIDLGNRDEIHGFREAARSETPSSRAAMERELPSVAPRFGVRWDASEDKETKDGVKLVHVGYGSAASAAGLQSGDRLLEFAGMPVTSGDRLRQLVLAARNPVAAKFAREGKEEPQDVEINLTGKPLRVGISWREDPAEPGSVHLVRVVPSSPAAIAGLRLRDRIYKIGGKDFADGNIFLERLNTLPNPIELVVERRGQLQTVEMTLPPREARAVEKKAE